MRRIFTFGCSFTEYFWPTWADIVLYENNGFNLGVSGGGYDSILYRITESDRVFKFTPDDLVIVVFTTPLRWDTTAYDEWSSHGQIYNNKQFEKYFDSLFSLNSLIFKSYHNMSLIDDYLKNKKVEYIFGSINNPLKNVGNYFENVEISTDSINLIEYVSKRVDLKLKDFNSFINKGETVSWPLTKKFKDNIGEYHPRPLTYYKWVKEELLKHVDIDIKITEEQIMDVENSIDKFKVVDDLNILKERYPKLYEKRVERVIFINDKYLKL